MAPSRSFYPGSQPTRPVLKQGDAKVRIGLAGKRNFPVCRGEPAAVGESPLQSVRVPQNGAFDWSPLFSVGGGPSWCRPLRGPQGLLTGALCGIGSACPTTLKSLPLGINANRQTPLDRMICRTLVRNPHSRPTKSGHHPLSPAFPQPASDTEDFVRSALGHSKHAKAKIPGNPGSGTVLHSQEGLLEPPMTSVIPSRMKHGASSGSLEATLE